MTREQRREAASRLAVQAYEILQAGDTMPKRFMRRWAFENLKDHPYHHLPGYLVEISFRNSEAGGLIILNLCTDPDSEMLEKDSNLLDDIELKLKEISGLPVIRERKKRNPQLV